MYAAKMWHVGVGTLTLSEICIRGKLPYAIGTKHVSWEPCGSGCPVFILSSGFPLHQEEQSMSANLAVFKPEVDCGIREGTQSRGRVLKVKKKRERCSLVS